MPTTTFHTTVLKKEAIDALVIQKDHWYVDCTLGGAGHTKEILARGGRVLGIDQDPEALAQASQILADFPKDSYILKKGNFSSLDELAQCLPEKPAGVLFDLGVSNYQLSGNGRGFSFQTDEPLDMRMDPDNQTLTAKDLVNGLYENELTKLLIEYGEEKFAKTITKRIVFTRKLKPIETTAQLRQIVESVYQSKFSTHSRINPATKTFQAFRILVNDELESLKIALQKSQEILKSNGILVIISFQGLEDQIIKSAFKTWNQAGIGEIMTKKPIVASDFEQELNPRSRSARLRIFKKH